MVVQPEWEIRRAWCIWQFVKKRANHSDLWALELVRDKDRTCDCNQGGTMLSVITGWISAAPHNVCEILLSVTVRTPRSLIRSVRAMDRGGGETSFQSNCIVSGNDSWLLCCPACKQRNLRRLMVVVVPGGGNSRLSQDLSTFYSNRSLPQASR